MIDNEKVNAIFGKDPAKITLDDWITAARYVRDLEERIAYLEADQKALYKLENELRKLIR